MYKFKTSEQNNDKATEFETKSLLYLLTKIKGHSSVNLFIIDCFNDVTAVSDNYSNSWDIQSKNVASLTPRTVGKALYTLFANYVSDIPFGHFILYLPQLKEPYVEDVSVELFTINNFKGTKSADVRTGLKSEIERRNDPDINTPSSVSRLDQFLSEVIFVVDKYGKSDYIKSIIEFKNLSRLDDDFLCGFLMKLEHFKQRKKLKVYMDKRSLLFKKQKNLIKTSIGRILNYSLLIE